MERVIWSAVFSLQGDANEPTQKVKTKAVLSTILLAVYVGGR
ncbi:hypothetical protein [Thermococcus peptonophilus]